jgi:hypothetical protein
LDPILAQGAGVAIEDAVLLSKALQNQYNNRSGSMSSSSKSKKKHADMSTQHDGSRNIDSENRDIPWHEITNAAIAELDSMRRSRIKKLELFSDISQGLGHMNSSTLCAIRDTLFALIPAAVKSLFFDQAIRIVSDDSHVRR